MFIALYKYYSDLLCGYIQGSRTFNTEEDGRNFVSSLLETNSYDMTYIDIVLCKVIESFDK
jgi:hypothetical protein